MARFRHSPMLTILGQTVRTFREALGLKQEQMAKQLGYTNGWLSNLETGQLRPRPDQLTRIAEVLHIPVKVLVNIRDQLDLETMPGYYRSWPLELENSYVVRTFDSALVPFLLWTPEYADSVHQGAEICAEPQAVFTDEHAEPPTLQVVLDEAALYRDRGGSEVMRDQLLHLIKSVAPPRVTVQVLRSADNPYPYGGFSVATGDDCDVGHVQTPARPIITNSREDIAALMAAWDAIRSCALSQRDSIDFIQRAADERWS